MSGSDEQRELPEGWILTPLDELVALRTGPFGSALHKSDYVPGGTPIINPMHIQNGRLVPSDGARVGQMALERLGEFRLNIGDVVLGRRGEMGRCAVVKPSEQGWLCGTGSLTLRTAGAIDSEYLQKFLSSPSAIRTLIGESVGSTMTNLNQGILKTLDTPLPPLNEQKRIVAKIDALTEKSREAREALEEVPELLDKLRQSILAAAFRGDLTREWRAKNPDVEPASVLLERIRQERREKWEEAQLAKFQAKGKLPKDDSWKKKYVEPQPVDTTDLPDLPEGWCWASLDDLVSEPLANGRSVQTREGGFPVLRLTALKNGKIDLSERKDGAWDAAAARPFLVADGDFLVSRGNGSLERVAIGGFVKDPDPVAFPDTLVRIRISRHVDRAFFSFAWANPITRAQIETRAKTTAGIHKVSQSDLGSIILPLAPEEEQREISTVLVVAMNSAGSQRDQFTSALDLLATLDSAILAKAFRGELVPQDPNDEPASVLLERIAAERATAEPTGKKPRSKRAK